MWSPERCITTLTNPIRWEMYSSNKDVVRIFICALTKPIRISFDGKKFNWKWIFLSKIFSINLSMFQVNLCNERKNDEWHQKWNTSSKIRNTFLALCQLNLLDSLYDERWYEKEIHLRKILFNFTLFFSKSKYVIASRIEDSIRNELLPPRFSSTSYVFQH